MKKTGTKLLSLLLTLSMLLSLVPVMSGTARADDSTAGSAVTAGAAVESTDAAAKGSSIQDASLSSYAPNLSDLSEAPWAEAAMRRWTQYGVLSGTSKGVDPNGTVTRAQVAQIFSKLLGLSDASITQIFYDLPGDAWYSAAIRKAVSAGILNGVSEHMIAPDQTVTREQFFTMFARAMGLKPQDSTSGSPADGSSWATRFINALTDRGYVKGDGKGVNALMNITRAGVMSLLDQAIGAYANVAGATVQGSNNGMVLVTAPDVTVTGAVQDIVVADGAKGADGVANVTLKDAIVTGQVSLTTAANLLIDGASAVANVVIGKNAANSNVEVSETSVVAAVSTEASGTSVSGKGLVSEVNADGAAVNSTSVSTANTVLNNGGTVSTVVASAPAAAPAAGSASTGSASTGSASTGSASTGSVSTGSSPVLLAPASNEIYDETYGVEISFRSSLLIPKDPEAPEQRQTATVPAAFYFNDKAGTVLDKVYVTGKADSTIANLLDNDAYLACSVSGQDGMKAVGSISAREATDTTFSVTFSPIDSGFKLDPGFYTFYIAKESGSTDTTADPIALFTLTIDAQPNAMPEFTLTTDKGTKTDSDYISAYFTGLNTGDKVQSITVTDSIDANLLNGVAYRTSLNGTIHIAAVTASGAVTPFGEMSAISISDGIFTSTITANSDAQTLKTAGRVYLVPYYNDDPLPSYDTNDNSYIHDALVTLDVSGSSSTKYAVTFKFENGDDDLKINVADGETVLASATSEQLSALTNPARTGYTFDKWVTRNWIGLTSEFKLDDAVTSSKTVYAQWSSESPSGTRTVTFDYNYKDEDGNPVIDVANVSVGSRVAMPDTPAREGYEFDGWYYGRLPYSFSVPVLVNFTLTAHWKEVKSEEETKYTVTFHYDQVKVADDKKEEVTSGATITEEPPEAADGYDVKGWCTRNWLGQYTLYNFDNAVTGDLDLYARYTPHTYTVTFDANGGTGASLTQTGFNYGEAKQLERNRFTRNGYVFTGWNTEAGGTGDSYADRASVKDLTQTDKGNVTLYAQWSLSSTSWIITYNANGGTGSMAQQSLPKNGSVTVSVSNFTRKGYEFVGWNTKADGTGTSFDPSVETSNTISGANVTGNVTLYAQWARAYTVTFNADGGKIALTDESSVETQKRTYSDGKMITDPPTPRRDNAAFLYWATRSRTFFWQDYTYTEYDLSKPVTGDLTLYAVWETAAEGEVIYKVEHYQQKVDDEDYELVLTEYLSGKAGDSTAAKAISYEGFTAQTVEQKTIAEDGSTVVEIKYDRNTVSFTYWRNRNAGDDAHTTSVRNVVYGSTDWKAQEPTGSWGYLDHTFIGWNTMSDGSGETVNISKPMLFTEEHMDLYAQWVETGSKNVTVTFLPNGAIALPRTQSVPVGVETELDKNTFTRPGYVFIGWNTQAEPSIGSGSTTYTDRVTLNADLTLYAQWLECYKVTLDHGYDGAPSVTQYPGVDADYTFQDVFDDSGWTTTPEREGYDFNGWYTSSGLFGTKVDLDSKITRDTTLYARWTAHTYTVRFNGNGGSGSMNDQTFRYGTEAALSENTFMRSGYTFTGWNTQADGTGDSYGDRARISLNLPDKATFTLYAQWMPNGTFHYVTLNANRGSGSVAPIAVKDGADLALDSVYPDAFSRRGYKLTGWNTQADGKGTHYALGDSLFDVTEDVTLYAEWTKLQTVTFNANGGTFANDKTTVEQEVLNGGTVTAPAANPSKGGETFRYWAIRTRTSLFPLTYEYTPFDLSTVIDDDMTLYACWQELGDDVVPYTVKHWREVSEYTLSFYEQDELAKHFTYIGGKWYSSVSTDYLSGKEGAAPEINERFFQGYKMDAPEGVITKEAVFEVFYRCTSFKITYLLNYKGAEENIEPRTVVYGSKWTLGDSMPNPETVLRDDGYYFDGWYTKATGGDKVDPDGYMLFAGDTTLYAHWVKDGAEVKVTFDANNGSGMSDSETGKAGKSIKLPECYFGVDGCTFVGWSTDPKAKSGDNGLLQPKDSYTLTGDTTFYAVWADAVTLVNVLVDYDYTFSLLPCTIGEPLDKDKADDMRDEHAPTGYTFDKWAVEVDGEYVAWDFSKSATKDLTLYALWTINSYTVKFASNGGSDGTGPRMQDLKLTFEQEVALPRNTFVRDRYTFAGWTAVLDNETVHFDDGEVICGLTAENNDTVTLTAQWIPTKDLGAITYDSNFDSDSDPYKQLVQLDTDVKLLDVYEDYADHLFVGWSTDPDAEPGDPEIIKAGDLYTPEDDVTFYAVWEDAVWIDFDPNGGKLLDEVGEECTGLSLLWSAGTLLDPEKIPTAMRSDGAFLGWTYDKEGKLACDLKEAKFDEDVTLYAQWEMVKEGETAYTVRHVLESLTGEYEGEPYLIERLSGEAGEETAATKLNIAGFAAPDITQEEIAEDGSTVVTVKYARNTYTITFHRSYDSGKGTRERKYGAAWGKLPTWSQDGYIFLGWYTEDGTRVNTDDNMYFTADTDLYAHWAPADTKYTVTFYGNGGVYGKDESYTKEFTAGVADTLDNQFTRDGYAFAGWATRANGTGTRYAGDKAVTIPNNLTLYAQWTAGYTVTFDYGKARGGETAKTVVAAGERVARPDDPEAEGYFFDGWFTGSSLRDSRYDFTSPVTKNMTLYARWTPYTYTVVFNSNGGKGTMEPQAFVYGTPQALRENTFTMSDRVFIGWDTQADGWGDEAYSNREIVENLSNINGGRVVLYAQWDEPTDLTIKLYPEGGTFVDDGSTKGRPIPVTLGGKYPTLPEVTRAGYDFTGWSDWGDVLIKTGDTVTSRSPLFATYQGKNYTVTLDAKGGTLSLLNSYMSVTFGEKYGSGRYITGETGLPTPEREGYNFVGWFAPDGTRVMNNSYVSIANDHTLNALWTRKTLIDLPHREEQEVLVANSLGDSLESEQYFESMRTDGSQYYVDVEVNTLITSTPIFFCVPVVAEDADYSVSYEFTSIDGRTQSILPSENAPEEFDAYDVFEIDVTERTALDEFGTISATYTQKGVGGYSVTVHYELWADDVSLLPFTNLLAADMQDSAEEPIEAEKLTNGTVSLTVGEPRTDVDYDFVIPVSFNQIDGNDLLVRAHTLDTEGYWLGIAIPHADSATYQASWNINYLVYADEVECDREFLGDDGTLYDEFYFNVPAPSSSIRTGYLLATYDEGGDAEATVLYEISFEHAQEAHAVTLKRESGESYQLVAHSDPFTLPADDLNISRWSIAVGSRVLEYKPGRTFAQLTADREFTAVYKQIGLGGANLYDNATGAEGDAVGKYTALTYERSDDVVAVNLKVDDLIYHKNGVGNWGYWAGLALIAPEGAKDFKFAFRDEDFSDDISSVEWTVNQGLDTNADGKRESLDDSTHDGAAFYLNVPASGTASKYLLIQWLDESGNPFTEVTKYQITVEASLSTGADAFVAAIMNDASVKDNLTLDYDDGKYQFIMSSTSNPNIGKLCGAIHTAGAESITLGGKDYEWDSAFDQSNLTKWVYKDGNTTLQLYKQVASDLSNNPFSCELTIDDVNVVIRPNAT